MFIIRPETITIINSFVILELELRNTFGRYIDVSFVKHKGRLRDKRDLISNHIGHWASVKLFPLPNQISGVYGSFIILIFVNLPIDKKSLE
jgi:hypothetical protein